MKLDRKNSDKIKEAVLGEFYCFDTLKSTNAEALASLDAPDKSLFYAKHQTAGRGRCGRRWEASEGGIYMTVLIKPEKIASDIPALTLAAGLAVAEAIPYSLIKWPNDIILNGKKTAGILLEAKTEGNSAAIAVGIGINANNKGFSGELAEKATSIALETGKMQDETELVIRVYNELLKAFDRFSQGFGKIKADYEKRCITLNREITVTANGVSRKMFAVGIGDGGELIAEENGKTEAISFGDASVRGVMGYI